MGAVDDDDDRWSGPGSIDFGSGVRGRFYSWAPDRAIEANATRYAGVPDVEKFGMTHAHLRPDNAARCVGAITFDSPSARIVAPDRPMWTVESWEPLTLSPSLLCTSCGRHGFIKQGRWVEA